jgi:hypothetical protein
MEGGAVTSLETICRVPELLVSAVVVPCTTLHGSSMHAANRNVASGVLFTNVLSLSGSPALGHDVGRD